MSKQKRPGTTDPARRLRKKVDEKFEPQHIVGDKEADPNKKTGSKYGKENTHSGVGDRRPKMGKKHRRVRRKLKKKFKEGVDMDSIVDAVRHILENHGRDVKEVMAGFEDRELLSKMAKKCLSTCLPGWEQTENGLMSENTDLVLSDSSWELAEDGSAKLIGGFQFDYDWLYDLSNASLITEDIAAETVMDKDALADTLSNAANLLQKLSDKEVKKYILNAAREDEDVDIMNLKEVLEDTGVNWEFIGAEVSGDKVNLLIRVRYTVDGTQEGVVEKKLSIEVKSGADVKEAGESGLPDDEEVDLAFPSSEGEEESPIASRLPERREESEIEPEAGLDLEVSL